MTADFSVAKLDTKDSGWLPWWLSGKESSGQRRRHGFDAQIQEAPPCPRATKLIPLLSLCSRAAGTP